MQGTLPHWWLLSQVLYTADGRAVIAADQHQDSLRGRSGTSILSHCKRPVYAA